MTADRPVLGILLMLGFCLIAPLADAIAKLIGNSVPIAEVVLVRFGLQALVLIPLIWWTGRSWRMGPRVLTLTFLRTLLHIVGIGAMFTALRYLPLADAVAIAFVMPFFMLLLGRYFLNEVVGPRRLVACSVGFAGTLLVVQPSFASVGWPALLPVLVAASFSLFMLVTRQIAKQTDPIGLQAVSGVIAVLLMVPLIFIDAGGDIAALVLLQTDAYYWGLLISIGLLGTLAHLLMTWSLRYAPSATLAPMQYLEIPFATVLGFFIFQDLPNQLASFGILLTILAGLYVIQGERANARRLVLQTDPPQAA
ncbi:MAG: DMT family transporter [Sulfitobacter sp.]|nr:DMT family transporter [Sulfitobacter sp.]